MEKALAAKPFWIILLALIILPVSTVAQSPQNLPDAPSAKRPPALPQTGPAKSPAPDTSGQPASDSSSSSTSSNPPQDQQPTDNGPTQPPPPMPPIKTVPKGQASGDQQTYTLPPVYVNEVLVPVTVKDSSGHLVQGLLKNNFAVYEDGVPQNINFFTSDPFPMAVAVVIDMGVSETTLRKVKAGLNALTGAFSEYDQVAIYTYAGTVAKMTDFDAVGDQLTIALRKIQERTGRVAGVAVPGGPMNSGPSVNGRPFDPGQAPSQIVPKESRVLNDALLAAALDLAKVDKAKRRVIMIISDGKESNSTTSYSDVLKLLLSHEVSVYAIGVDSAAIPLYRKLATMNIPGTYNANILPKYASATGGEVFAEFSRSSIESAYAEITEQARNQYTLGYRSRATLAGNYRQIEVRVHRPGLKIFTRDGYYPLPPQPARP